MDLQNKTKAELILELQKLQIENKVLKQQFPSETAANSLFNNLNNESKEFFELIFNTSPDAAIIVRLPDSKVLKVNDGFTKITGYSRKEALETTVLDLKLYENLNDRQNIINEILKNGHCESYECVFVRKDGSTLTGIVSAKLFFHDGIPHIYSVTHDISKRKLAEETKKEADELFKHIFDYSNVAKSITSLNNDIQINEAFRLLLGYSSDEIKNLNWPRITHPDDIELTLNQGNRIVRGEVNQIRFFKRYLHKNGSVIWADVSSSAIRNKDGKIRCLITTIFDVTEQTLAQKALKISEERYRESQLIGNVAHWEYNFKTDKLYWSDQLYTIYGVSKDKFEPTLKDSLAASHPNDQETIRSMYFESIKNKTNFYIESRLITPEGIIKYLVTRAKTKYDTEGNPISMLGTVVDITERKKIEEELIQSHQELRKFSNYLLKAREKERAEITLEIHDSVAQYLVALKVNMGLYLKKISNTTVALSPAEVKEKMEQLVYQVDKTLHSARMIMNGLRPDQLELLGLVEAIEVHLYNFEEIHHIKCIFKNTITEPIIKQEESIIIFRILQESLINVLKHAKASSVTVSLTKTNENISIKILDNGVGFDENIKFNSNSYGVISMREQVKAINGTFTIKSVLSQGTTVRVEIPYND